MHHAAFADFLGNDFCSLVFDFQNFLGMGLCSSITWYFEGDWFPYDANAEHALSGCPSHLWSSSVGQSPQEHILPFPSDNILDRILPKNSHPSCISCWIIALLQSTEMINFAIFGKLFRKASTLFVVVLAVLLYRFHFWELSFRFGYFCVAENIFWFAWFFKLVPWVCPTWRPHFTRHFPKHLMTDFCELESPSREIISRPQPSSWAWW